AARRRRAGEGHAGADGPVQVHICDIVIRVHGEIMRTRVLLMAVGTALAMFPCALADPFDDLAREFWQWRAVQQPTSQDDIPRIDRPAAWTPEWSKDAVARQREQLKAFEQRWKGLDSSGWSVPRQVD